MTHLRSIACGLLAATAALVSCLPAAGEDGDGGWRQFNPSDVYFQAWLTVREADKLEKEEKYLEAFNKYDKGKKLFDSVALYHPEWKADLVQDRQKITAESMARIKDKALAEQQKDQRKTKDLVEGPDVPAPRKDFEVPQLSQAEQRQISALQRQIAQYQNELRKARSDRDANAVRLRNALRELEAKRDRMARAPVAGQLDELNQRISKLERERNAMAAALRDSRAENQEVLSKLATAEADAIAAKERAEQLDQMVRVQQKAANQAVEGLRRQLKEMKELVVEKDKQLTSLQARTGQLERQLQEAQAEILDLRDERESLLVERDQMAALLKLNESDRVQLLIKQNMELGKDLKAALDRVNELHADNNATKDQLIEARRDLAFAKGRIIEFQTQAASQNTRLEELEERLRNARKDLTAELEEPNLDPRSRQETELLRGIISRQLKVQERRKLTKEALIAEIQRAGLVESPLNAQFNAFLGQELKLTAEESELIKDYKIDQDFIFADRPNEREFVDAAQELQESIYIKSKLARRAYSKERYLAAREVFESILDEHPGHVNTILNLGVVHLKSDDIKLAVETFNNALVIRGDNLPFAHFMLGVCYYYNALRANNERDERDGMAQARLCLEKSLNQDANNAEAHVFLGSVAGEGNNLDEAEHHFKEAIRINPTLTEPYYNLALIYNERGRKDEAREYYKKALENGAPFDPKLDYLLSAVVR